MTQQYPWRSTTTRRYALPLDVVSPLGHLNLWVMDGGRRRRGRRHADE